jgi:hypothetical protein
MVIDLRKATRNFSHNNTFPGLDENPVLPSKTTGITARAICPIRGCGYRFLVSHFCDGNLTLSHRRHDVKLTSEYFIHIFVCIVYKGLYTYTVYYVHVNLYFPTRLFPSKGDQN